MLRQGGGAIVNCSSIGGVIGGIRINAVCPGTIKTPMAQEINGGDPKGLAEFVKDEPIGRLGEPEEIAAAVLWLCSPGASYVVGHALLVDGGYTAR